MLSPEDSRRNDRGRDVLLFSDRHHQLYSDVSKAFYSKKARQGPTTHQLSPKLSDGLSGVVEKIPDSEYLPHCTLEYPLERNTMENIDSDRSLR